MKEGLCIDDCRDCIIEDDEFVFDSISLPQYIVCPLCGSDAFRDGEYNNYVCSNDDCGWNGAIDR